MLYLAQVIKNIMSGKLELHLLAVEESKLQWTFCHEKFISFQDDAEGTLHDRTFSEGLLLLVELDDGDKIIRCRDAKDWLLKIIREYLVEGNINTNINVSEEQIRIEKWRQELTSQSQDLTRIRLEIETRREELQELEQKLYLEKEKLNSLGDGEDKI